MPELRIIFWQNEYHGFQDSSEVKNYAYASGETILQVFASFYGKPNVTEIHTLENLQEHLLPGMCVWLYHHTEWWFAQVGGCDMEPDTMPDGRSVFRAASFREYAFAASRINWTDALSHITYEYEESVWWRRIHNDGATK